MTRLSLILIICLPFVGKAQIGTICVDSNRVNPYYQCNDPAFSPVCGCNNVTYRNGCEMTNIGGVNYASSFDNGVCQSDLYYHTISPNPVRNILNFKMQFADQQSANGTLQIYSIFGDIVYSELLNSVTSFPFEKSIDLTGLETGVYTLLVQAKGVYKISRFIKHDY